MGLTEYTISVNHMSICDIYAMLRKISGNVFEIPVHLIFQFHRQKPVTLCRV